MVEDGVGVEVEGEARVVVVRISEHPDLTAKSDEEVFYTEEFGG